MKIKNYDDFIFENIEPSKNFNEEYKVIAEKFEHFWQTLKMKLAEMEKINARDVDDVVIYNNNIKKGGSGATSVSKKRPITPILGSENKPGDSSTVTSVSETPPVKPRNQNPEFQQSSPDPSKKEFVDETAKEKRRRKKEELAKIEAERSKINKTEKTDDDSENVEKIFRKPVGPINLVQAK